MSYVKKIWVNGEIINATQLNRIEDAIEELYENSIELATNADCDSLFDDFLED